ncbi:type II toxin-antitoxin system VapC family toxin [Candidatus Woesearchaeota archaeon]|nr:type II toxin-antitoxin system VapC family toxin [Candidatus Woesearchaeota archaeon]
MKVLDTTFLIDVLRGEKETLKILNSKDLLLTTQINMYEVIRGLFIRKISDERFREVIHTFDDMRLLSLDNRAIIKSADISAQLVKKGAIISDCDCMTAGITLSNNINTIVTRNIEHFKRINGIQVETY